MPVPPSPSRAGGNFSSLSLEEQKARRMARLQSMSSYGPPAGRFERYTESVLPPTPFHPSTNQNALHPNNGPVTQAAGAQSEADAAIGVIQSTKDINPSLRSMSTGTTGTRGPAGNRALSAWTCTNPKGAFATLGIVLFGALKGLLMCPLIIPAHIIGCLLINMYYILAAFDYGFAAIRFTRYLGPNLKALSFVLFPFFYILFFVISPILALFFSLAFSFAYPAYVTLDAFRQSGMRHSVTRSAWAQTIEQTSTNIVGYAYAYSLLLPEWTHKVITAKYRTVAVPPPSQTAGAPAGQLKDTPAPTGPTSKDVPIDPYEIHPLDWFVGFLVAVLVFPIFGGLLAILATLKLLPIIARAYINHFSAAGNWFKAGKTAIAWVLYLPFIPVVAVFLIPGSFLYSAYIAWKSAGAVITAHGNPLACWPIIKTSFGGVNKSSTRFIKGLDVPFVVLPQKKLAIQWVIAATLPFIVGIIVLPVPLLLLALLFIIPVIIRSYSEIELHLTNGGRNTTQASRSIPLYLLIVLLPVVVPVALILYSLVTVLKMIKVFVACSDAKGIGIGFDHIPGILYYFEYKLNEYCFKRRSDETLHAFSMMPGFKDACRRANLLPPSEYDAPFVYSGSIVTPQARYVPPGTRKPKFDANGRMVDMSGAAIHIPGVGVAPIINGNIAADSVIPILPPGQTRLPANVTVPEALLAQPAPSPVFAPGGAALAQHQQQQQVAIPVNGADAKPAINTSGAPSPATSAATSAGTAAVGVNSSTSNTPTSATSNASGFSIFGAATGKAKENNNATPDPHDHAEIAIRTRRAAGCLCCAANAAAGEDPFHTEADERARAAALHEAKLEAALKAAAQIEAEAKASAEAARRAAEQAAASAAAEEAVRAKLAADEAARRAEVERARKDLEEREAVLRQAMAIVNDARADDLAAAQRLAAANAEAANAGLSVASIPIVASPTAQKVLESQSIKAASFIGAPVEVALGLAAPSPKKSAPQTPTAVGAAPQAVEAEAQHSPALVNVELGDSAVRKAAEEALVSLEGLAASIQTNIPHVDSSDALSASNSAAQPLMTDAHARALQAMGAARSIMQAAQTATVASKTARAAREQHHSASPERQAARVLVSNVEAGSPSSRAAAGGGRRNSSVGLGPDGFPLPSQGRRASLVGGPERGRRRSSVADHSAAAAAATAAAAAGAVVIPLVPAGPDGSTSPSGGNVLPSSASAVRRASAALGALAAATALTEQYQGALAAASNSVAVASALVEQATGTTVIRGSPENRNNDGRSGGSSSSATRARRGSAVIYAADDGSNNSSASASNANAAAVAGRARRPSNARASMTAVSLDTAPSSSAAAAAAGSHSRQPSNQRQSIVNIIPSSKGNSSKGAAVATATSAPEEDEDDGSVILSISEVPINKQAQQRGAPAAAKDQDGDSDDGLEIISS